MGADFMGELVAVLSSGKSQGNLLMQALVALFDPVLLVLAMLINQLGNGRAMSGLLGLDLLVERVQNGFKAFRALLLVEQSVMDTGTKEAKTNACVLELDHGASVGVNMVTTLSIGSAVIKTCDRFRSRMWDTTD